MDQSTNLAAKPWRSYRFRASIDAMAKPGVPWVDVVKEQFGEDVLKSLKKRWKEAGVAIRVVD